MTYLYRLFLLFMMLRSIFFMLFNFLKLINSYNKFKSIKQKKTKEKVLILSGGKINRDLTSYKDVDIFANSIAYTCIPEELTSQTKVLFLGRLEEQNTSKNFNNRIKEAKSKFKNSEIITESSKKQKNKKDVYSIRSAYLLGLNYPFLRPYNGPVLLIWLAYCLGYKEIILEGIESTMIKGVVMSRELYGDNVKSNDLYKTRSISYVSICNSLMLYEYDLLFNKICKKLKVTQTSQTSWSQPNLYDRMVCAADDSWRDVLLKRAEK